METKIIGISLDELQRLMQTTIRGEIESLLQMPVTGNGIQDELWDRKQAAEFLGISEQTITKLYLQGRINGQKSGRKFHFLKSEIINFLKSKS
jgi:excisionase family DNA binding protein